MDVTGVEAVQIHARYDTGEPMAGAQVVIFSPDNPGEPWMIGATDSAGRFVFVPDERQGRWAIQARQAGHGAINYFALEDQGAVGTALTATQPSGGTTLLQRLLMIGSVAWGCIGTALYFKRSRIREAG